MQITLKHLLVLVVLAAVCCSIVASRKLRPPSSYGRHSNRQVVIRGEQRIEYHKYSIENYGVTVLGYYAKSTPQSSGTVGDDRVQIRSGMLFLDGKRVYPVPGKVIVLLRENMGTPKAIELTLEERDRFTDFMAGDGREDGWEKLWEDLFAKSSL